MITTAIGVALHVRKTAAEVAEDLPDLGAEASVGVTAGTGEAPAGTMAAVLRIADHITRGLCIRAGDLGARLMLDPVLREDPYPFYHQLREQGRIVT